MLKKLSLAALVAMGTMSVASASTDLSDAIKGVTIGGFLRYRGTEDNTKPDSDANHENTTKNEYKAVLNMNIKASDAMTVHGRLVYLNKYYSNKSAVDDQKDKNKDYNMNHLYSQKHYNNGNKSTFNVREAYLNYKANGLNVKAGQQALVTPLTDHDDDYANGVLASYTMSGITGVAAYYNHLSNAGATTTLTNNIGVLAVVADIKPVKVQAWYYNVSDSGDDNKDGKDAYFIEAGANVGPAAVRAQYISKKQDDKDRQKFWAVAATGKVDVASVTAAYLDFGKDGSNVTVGTTNADKQIAAGDILTDMIQQDNVNINDGWAGALVASAKYGAVKAGVQYVHATVDKSEDKTKLNEYDLDLAYAYTKKLNFSGYYAVLKNDCGSDDDETTTEFRFEAKYSF